MHIGYRKPQNTALMNVLVIATAGSDTKLFVKPKRGSLRSPCTNVAAALLLCSRAFTIRLASPPSQEDPAYYLVSSEQSPERCF